MATREQYAQWIVANSDKKGTPEFDTVSRAYQEASSASAAEKQTAPAKEIGFGEDLSNAISDIPRQVGLTGRYLVEGVGNTLDFLASPIRGALNLAGANIQPGVGKTIADAAQLPQPRNSTERVVGEGARFLASTAVPLGISNRLASVGTGNTQAIGRQLAQRPTTQLASAGSSGLADSYINETGGSDTARAVGSVAAGLATPFAIDRTQSIGNSVNRLAQRVTQPAPTSQAINIQIDRAVNDSGINLASLPQEIQAGIRSDVANALKTGGDISPDALRRLADYRTVGAIPRSGNLTLDPVQITQQRNLAKLGANSRDPAAQQLAQVENQNNAVLINRLNESGAARATSPYNAGESVMGALDARSRQAQQSINDRYQAARDTTGRAASLDPRAFTEGADQVLTERLLNAKLPADVRNMMNGVARGEIPLTVDVAEQIKTRLGQLQRSTSDGQERLALGEVRRALDNTPLLPGQEIGEESIQAFNRARRLNRTWEGIVERTPALQAVREGIEPDKFVQQYIIGNGNKTNVADLQALRSALRQNPAEMDVVRNQITSYLKDKALNGAADEVGNFSQSAYNKALRQLGDNKLRIFFTPEQIEEFKTVGRVASYEQFQPKGSAVNNSNTAGAAVGSILDRIGNSPLLSKIPFGNQISEPIRNISVGMQAGSILNPNSALVMPQNRLATQRRSPLMVPPAVFIGGEE